MIGIAIGVICTHYTKKCKIKFPHLDQNRSLNSHRGGNDKNTIDRELYLFCSIQGLQCSRHRILTNEGQSSGKCHSSRQYQVHPEEIAPTLQRHLSRLHSLISGANWLLVESDIWKQIKSIKNAPFLQERLM